MLVLFCFAFWLLLWTIAIYKFRIDEEENQLLSKLVLFFTAPFFHLVVLVWFGVRGYIKRDWNELAD
jgi:hypothetical protein